jgi:hypothetical protein
MKREIIRDRCQDLQIPFSHGLSAVLAETLAEEMSLEPFGKDLWLISRQDLEVEQYRKKPCSRLSYMNGGPLEKRGLHQAMLLVLRTNLERKEMKVEKITADEDGLHLSVRMEDMYVPFTLETVQAPQSHIFPKQEKIHLYMENRDITCYSYPSEQGLAYHLADIFGKLELENEMDHYRIAYDILKKNPLEGREVQDAWMLLCQQRHIPVTEDVMKLWKSYGSYPYMEKKWKAYLRRQKIKEPVWREVHRLLLKFTEPMWQAMVREKIFFGDWMPELERYLE